MTPFHVAIFGASGYGGQELLRLLASHPRMQVAAATSDRLAGHRVADELPQLAGFFDDLRFQPTDAPLLTCDAAFLATPHGVATELFRVLRERHPDLRVVDLSHDHRAPGHHPFVYGLTETNRDAIAKAQYVANPGCFATGALLALAPLAERGLLEGDVTLAQTTGSSGSGAHAKPTTHHPERAQDQRAYKVLTHQHEPEIATELERLGAGRLDLALVPQSGPFARGIFTVAHVRVKDASRVRELYGERYEGVPFVRMRKDTPALRHVARTNFCDLALHARGDRVVVLTAIDNLGKGMAGQAIQNLNLMCGLEETEGLRAPGAGT